MQSHKGTKYRHPVKAWGYQFLPGGAVVANGLDGCLDVRSEDTGVDVVDSGPRSGVMSPDPDPGAEVTSDTGWVRSIGSTIRKFSLQLSLSEQQIYSSVSELKEPWLQT